jgi:hypothetical protein
MHMVEQQSLPCVQPFQPAPPQQAFVKHAA